ncbi:hypothetical protein D9M68_745490 [compost metagenome]
MHQNFWVASRRCRALELPTPTYVWQQGESSHATSIADYLTPLRAIIASVRDEDMNSARWLIGKSTWSTDGVTYKTSPTTREACAAAVNNVDIFAGADTDTLLGPTYRSAAGGLHFTAAGADAAAQLWADAIRLAL